MRVRPTLSQGLPAALAAIPLLPYLISADMLGMVRNKAFRMFAQIAVFSLGIVLVIVGVSGFLKSFGSQYQPLGLARATGIKVPQSFAHYAELVRYIDKQTVPGEPIYSGVEDHTLLNVNDAILYFLADRPSATRFVQMDPGLANTLSAQTEIRDALEAKRVKLVVLFRFKSGEPNLSSRSNGIFLLDKFLDDRYRETRRFGNYSVLEPRP
jgi:hypothetical protein